LDAGYRAATFSEAVTAAAPGGKTFAVTFDDGYHSVRAAAFPILSRLGIPGTVFTCTDFVGTETPMPLDLDCWADEGYARELLPMSWDDLGELRAAGWEIGSHTGSHPHLPALDDGALAAELARSRAECRDR